MPWRPPWGGRFWKRSCSDPDDPYLDEPCLTTTRKQEFETLTRMLLLPTALLACAVASCGQNYSDKPAAAALAERNLTPVGSSAASSPALRAVVSDVPAYGETPAAGNQQEWAQVRTTVPAGWQAQTPSSSMRIAQYSVPATHGGEGASLAVFEGNMGSVDDNVRRWIGQFSQPDGSDSVSKARRWKLQTDGGLEVTLVDASGTYDGGMGRGGEPVEDYRVLGAIVHTGSTYLYLKLVGPRDELEDLQKPFEQMILSMKVD